MKKIVLLITALVVSSFAMAQSKISGDIASFNVLNISGDIELTLVKSDANSFTAEISDESATDRFEWSVKNGELLFKLKQPINFNKKEKITAKITLNYKELSTIIAASATILAQEAVVMPILDFSIDSKAVVAIEVDCKDLRVKATNATATFTGKSEYVTIKASGAASVNTVAMSVDIANVSTQTNAECYVTATKKLDLRAITNSNIFYKGVPEILNTSNATLGKVEGF